MTALRFVWKLLCICTAAKWLYLAVLFIGASFDMNAIPEVSTFTIGLVFLGSAMLMVEIAFPSLRQP